MSTPSGRVRSKNGCLTCKNRRKKCDETHPICERCTKAGIPCLGYSESGSHVVAPKIRSKAAARVAAARAQSSDSNPSQARSARPYAPATSASPKEDSRLPASSQNLLQPLVPGVTMDGIFSTADALQALAAGFTSHGLPIDNDLFDFSFMSPDSSDLPLGTHFNGDSNGWSAGLMPDGLRTWNSAQSPTRPGSFTPNASTGQTTTGGSCPLADGRQTSVVPYAKPSSASDGPKSMTAGQASLFNALLSLGQPSVGTSTSTSPASCSAFTTPPSSSTWPSPDSGQEDEDSATSDESDPEGVRDIVCGTPALDSAVQSNSLPFVLFSYANWITRTIFEPLKLAHKVKGWVTSRYTHSEDSRASITMLAGVLSTLWSKGPMSAKNIPAASMLESRVRRRIIQAGSHLGSSAQNDSEVSKALEEALEILNIQFFTCPLSSVVVLLAEAAPLFRRACPEPPDAPIDLPTKFIHPDWNLRQYAVMDVTLSASTFRPMHFRYDVRYGHELCGNLSLVENMGVQWLNGIPDQIVLILARMNMLRDDCAPNVDPLVVTEIEQELKDFKSVSVASADSYLMIARLAVQECWRQVVYIYLYMGLCGARAKDPRVEKARKSFMRLFERTKPGRTPDSFLIVPLIMVGVAVYKQRERDLIRQRMLGLQECVTPGTCGHDAVRMLEDIWSRASAEGRTAVWQDLKISHLKIVGV